MCVILGLVSVIDYTSMTITLDLESLTIYQCYGCNDPFEGNVVWYVFDRAGRRGPYCKHCYMAQL